MNNKAMPRATGVVLAGGRSSRFGRDKGLHRFRGEPLVSHALKTIRPVCRELMVSTGNRQGYAFLNLPLLPDLFPGAGPMAGIHSALVHAGEDRVVIIGCDTPFIPPELPALLLQELGDHQLILPVHRGFTETMCAVYKKECLPLVEQALKAGVHRILDVADRLHVRHLPVDGQAFYHADLFRNINRPGDLPA